MRLGALQNIKLSLLQTLEHLVHFSPIKNLRHILCISYMALLSDYLLKNSLYCIGMPRISGTEWNAGMKDWNDKFLIIPSFLEKI